MKQNIVGGEGEESLEHSKSSLEPYKMACVKDILNSVIKKLKEPHNNILSS